MKKIFGISALALGASFLLFNTAAFAGQWQIVGPRAIGMGGAHVAVVNDATAQYWNPAAFGFFGRQAGDYDNIDEHSDRDFGIYAYGGAGYQTHEDFIQEVEDVQDYDFDALSADINAGGIDAANVDEYVRIIAELEDLNQDDMGATWLANAGIHARYKNWAVGVMGSADIAGIPYFDTVNISPGTAGADMIAQLAAMPTGGSTTLTAGQKADLITRIDALSGWDATDPEDYVTAVDHALATGGVPVTQDVIDDIYTTALVASRATSGGNFDSNQSKITFNGAIIQEIPLTYGHAFSDGFSIGGNIKAMNARVYHTEVLVKDSDTEDFFKEAEDDYEESSDYGVDAGALYKIGPLRLGIVGRNLNTPSFDYAGAGQYELAPQVRAGVAIRLWNWITLAADADLTENDTNVSDDYKSQNVGVGAEFDLFKFLRLRAGGYKNIAEEDIGPVYTAGLGLNLYLFQLDIGASMSTDTATIDGEELPEEVRGELALSFQY